MGRLETIGILAQDKRYQPPMIVDIALRDVTSTSMIAVGIHRRPRPSGGPHRMDEGVSLGAIATPQIWCGLTVLPNMGSLLHQSYI